MSHGVTGIGAWKELAEPMFKAVRARSESSFATDNLLWLTSVTTRLSTRD
jgi:hypothetical protein